MTHFPRPSFVLFVLLSIAVLAGLWITYGLIDAAGVQFQQEFEEAMHLDADLVSVFNATSERILDLEVSFLVRTAEGWWNEVDPVGGAGQTLKIGELAGNAGWEQRVQTAPAGSFTLSVRGRLENGQKIENSVDFFSRPASPLQIAITSDGSLSFR